jgi:cytochrome c oxidase assembly protein subunit 15
MKNNNTTLNRLLGLAACGTMLALLVIVLGAWVRLSHAGLGCPDWPGCYGQIIAPDELHEIAQANAAFPHRPVETDKAWKEMAHRYLASTLGLVIILLAAFSWRARKLTGVTWLPLMLVVLVIFQGLLGMWTVTLLLKPAVVTMHLLMGMLTAALLWLTALRLYRVKADVNAPAQSSLRAANISLNTSSRLARPASTTLRWWAAGAMLLVYMQIGLGGWTSTNYVALHCWDLPTCQGQWWPSMDFKEGFRIWREVGVDYEGGVLSMEAGTAVHMTHRLGAITVLLLVGSLLVSLLRVSFDHVTKRIALVGLLALLLQVSLGLLNILLVLPLPVAVAHNGGAAVLLLTMVTLNYRMFCCFQDNQCTESNAIDSSEESTGRFGLAGGLQK